MLNVYDAVVSLGGNCGAASQLRMRGLRTCSFPFDWTYMDGPETINWLESGFGNGFSDFCLRENLRPIERDGVSGLAPFKYKDLASGYNFIHHFWKNAATDAGYHATYDVLRRRADRLLACVGKSRSLLFVLATNFEYDPALAVRLMESLRSANPGKTIDFHVLQHCATFDNPLVIAEKWPDDMPFTGGRYARRIFTYDFSRTDAEWDFLDRISLSGSGGHKRFTGLDRFKYKIWKKLSKRFRDNGYACAGLRFR